MVTESGKPNKGPNDARVAEGAKRGVMGVMLDVCQNMIARTGGL